MRCLRGNKKCARAHPRRNIPNPLPPSIAETPSLNKRKPSFSPCVAATMRQRYKFHHSASVTTPVMCKTLGYDQTPSCVYESRRWLFSLWASVFSLTHHVCMFNHSVTSVTTSTVALRSARPRVYRRNGAQSDEGRSGEDSGEASDGTAATPKRGDRLDGQRACAA